MKELIHNPVMIIVFLSLSGFALRTVLVLSGQIWCKTYQYLATYILLPNVAFVITSVIAENIALSLGMIGALSIVRFRHPVKSHFELTMYFALITLGIAAGVNLKYALLLVALIVMVVLGIFALEKIINKFNLSLYQLSFSEGIGHNVLEISSNAKIEEIENSENMVDSFYLQSEKRWEYKIIFKEKKDLKNFLEKSINKENIIEYRISSTLS